MPESETPTGGNGPESGTESSPPRPGSESQPADTGQGQSTWRGGGETFDSERAKRLIDELRPYETKAKQLEHENAELKAEVDKHRLDQLTELERLQEQVSKLTAQNADLSRQYGEMQLTHEITRLA